MNEAVKALLQGLEGEQALLIAVVLLLVLLGPNLKPIVEIGHSFFGTRKKLELRLLELQVRKLEQDVEPAPVVPDDEEDVEDDYPDRRRRIVRFIIRCFALVMGSVYLGLALVHLGFQLVSVPVEGSWFSFALYAWAFFFIARVEDKWIPELWSAVTEVRRKTRRVLNDLRAENARNVDEVRQIRAVLDSCPRCKGQGLQGSAPSSPASVPSFSSVTPAAERPAPGATEGIEPDDDTRGSDSRLSLRCANRATRAKVVLSSSHAPS